MVTTIATFQVQEGKMDEVIELLKEVVPLVRESEPGCLAYIPHAVKGKKNKNTIIFYEKYEDDAAYNTHAENFPDYFKKIAPLIQGNLDVKTCEEIV